MGSIGEALKEERIRRELSLADVHEATKITLTNLTSLEEERFDVFANKVYARAFLRDYANFLGIDSGELLARYEEEYGSLSASVQPQRRGFPVGAALLSILLAAVAIGGLYYAVVGQSSRVPEEQHHMSAPISPEPVIPAPESAAPEQVSPGVPEADAVPAPTPKPPDAEALSVSESLRVRIAALEKSWIKVWLDGKPAYEGTLAAGDVSEWEAKSTVRLRTGNAGGLQIKVDGKTQSPLGRSGQIAEQAWRKGSEPPPASPAPAAE